MYGDVSVGATKKWKKPREAVLLISHRRDVV
jgi:hypothetical protein